MTNTPTSATPAQKFIDISSNNFNGGKTINFDAYWKAGYRWLFVKRTEGTGYTWTAGAAIIDAWHKRGGHVGHYHWLRPDSDAASQADYFTGVLATSGKPAAGDVLMTDFEASYNYATGQQVSDGTDAQRAAALTTFNARVAGKYPHNELLVYTGNWYLERFGAAVLTAVKKHRVVISEYTGAASPNNRFGLNLAAYQFTDRATVPGVSAPVDCNVWLTDPAATKVSALKKLARLLGVVRRRNKLRDERLGNLRKDVNDLEALRKQVNDLSTRVGTLEKAAKAK